MRERGWQERYSARVEDAQTLSFFYVKQSITKQLRLITLPQPLVVGREYQLELRIVGSRLSVSLNGVLLDAREHSVHVEPGRFGAVNYTEADQTIQALEFLDLDPPAATENALGPWQPLFTDAEWKETVPGKREVVDGRLHLQGGTSVLKPLPAADGAIRARIQFREGSNAIAIQARTTPDNSKYKLLFHQSSVRLQFFPGGGAEAILLRLYSLPKPIQTGDTVLLELRLQGDRLTALVDGKVAIEAQDSRIPGPGTWGFMADDGWFESAEVQSPLPAAAPPAAPAFGPWQPLFTEAEWKESKSRKQIVDGRVHLESQFMLKPQPAADGAIRARISIAEAWPKYAAIIARDAKGMGQYKLQVQGTVQAGGTAVALMYFTSDLKGIELERKYLSKSPPPGGLVLELRLLGNRLSALVDDTLLFEVRDSRLSEPGEWGLMASDSWFESVEVQTPLPAATDGWEDVFAKLTPEIDAQTGHGWTLKDGEFFSPDGKQATLPLPGKWSGTSYQVRVKLRQLTKKDVFHIVLPVADRMCGFDLEGGRVSGSIYTGLCLVNGKWGKDLPGVVEGKQVNDTAAHDLEVTVRLDGANATITTTLDTRPLYAWTGPTAALSQHPVWTTTKPGALALGTYAGGWAVSEVKVKRLDAGK